MIAIIAAEYEELMAFYEQIEDSRKEEHHGITYHIGKLGKQEVVIVQSGIGKVAAAIVCMQLLQIYPIHHVINVGTAGATSNKTKIMDFVLASQVGYGDADVTVFGKYEYGQLPNQPRFFPCDDELTKRALSLTPPFPHTLHLGTLISGDMFFHDKEKLISLIATHYQEDHVLSYDMESASIGQCCYFFKIPYTAIRIISDIIGNSEQVMQYEEVVIRSSYPLAVFLKEMLNKGE